MGTWLFGRSSKIRDIPAVLSDVECDETARPEGGRYPPRQAQALRRVVHLVTIGSMNPRTTPGPQVRAEIEKMLALWDSRLGEPTKVRDGVDVGDAFMVEALTTHVVRLTRAVLALADAGFTVEAMPLIRLSLECGVTTAWLVLSEGAGNSLTHEGARLRRAALKEAVKRGPGFESSLAQTKEVLSTLEADAAGEGRHFERRCLALDGGDELYLLFRVASSLSHAGLGISDFYAEEAIDELFGIRMAPHADLEDMDVWVAIQGAMLLRCLIATNHVNVNFKRTRQLERFAKLFDVSTEVGEVRIDR